MLYAYLDESGDPGFHETATPFFVLTLLLVDYQCQTGLREAVDRLRVDLGFSRDPEFRFASTPPATRRRFLTAVRSWEFLAVALVVEKSRVGEPHLKSRESLYDYFVSRLLSDDTLALHDIDLTADSRMGGSNAGRRAAQRLRACLNEAGITRVRQVRYRDSRGDNLLQVADMISGSIYHHFARGDDQFLQIVRRRVNILEM